MAKKRCTNCAEKIQWTASKCRYCGTEQPPQQGPEPLGPVTKGCLWIFGIVAALFAIVLFGPHDAGTMALQRCDETVFIGGQEIPKLSAEERMKCREAVLNPDAASSR